MSTTLFFEENRAGFAEYLQTQQHNTLILLADAKSNGFCLPVLKDLFPQLSELPMIVIPDGENNKNLEVARLIWDQVMDLHASRQAILINVGGGMVSDIGGFAASVYKRGIRYINIPTTLLAACDASVGGKTGIDYRGVKNCVGSFQHPEAVYVDPVFFKTLDTRILRSGIAEMIKHGLLGELSSFEEMSSFTEDDFYAPNRVKRSLLFKQDIVNQDEYDDHIRQVLNLGHSISHAIESLSLDSSEPLLHGEAVMLGLLYELQLSIMIFELPADILHKTLELKKRIFPDLHFGFACSQLVPYLFHDKKNTGHLRMSLLKQVGNCQWQTRVSIEQVNEAIEIVNQFLATEK